MSQISYLSVQEYPQAYQKHTPALAPKRQNDNLPSDPGQTQLYVPVLSEAINAYKYTVGFASGLLGQLLLRNRILGP